MFFTFTAAGIFLMLDSDGMGNFKYISDLLLSIFLIELVIIIISVIVYFIITWLKSNWQLAAQDAKKELGKRKKK